MECYIDNTGIVDKARDLRQSREYRSGSRGSITTNGLRIFQASGVVGCEVRAFGMCEVVNHASCELDSKWTCGSMRG